MSEVSYWLKDASPRNKALLPAGGEVRGSPPARNEWTRTKSYRYRRAAAGRAQLVAEIAAQLEGMGHEELLHVRNRNCIAAVSPGIAAVSRL